MKRDFRLWHISDMVRFRVEFRYAIKSGLSPNSSKSLRPVHSP